MDLIHLFSIVALNWLGIAIAAYCKKKGENRARKEDIREITEQVEEAKTSFAEDMAYLKKKGEDQATREDIEEITEIVESVRGAHAKAIEEARAISDRVTGTHANMVECMKGTLLLYREMQNLLREVSSRATYSDRVTGKITGNAFDRFTKRQPEIAKQFRAIAHLQEIFFPEPVYVASSDVLRAINEAIVVAYRMKPGENGVFPDTSKLDDRMVDAMASYETCVTEFRNHCGVNALKRLKLNNIAGGEKTTSEEIQK